MLLQVGTLHGAGLVDASGGQGLACIDASGAGGRRIAVYGALAGFDPVAQLRAQGGQTTAGGPVSGYVAVGTVFTKLPSQTYGSLLIDNGAGRPAAPTELPALGAGALVSLLPIAGSADTWAAAGAPFATPWLGAWMVLLDGGGNALGGGFQVVALDGQGRARLAGAAAVTGAASYRGEYRFDGYQLLDNGSLIAHDPIIAVELTLAGRPGGGRPRGAGREPDGQERRGGQAVERRGRPLRRRRQADGRGRGDDRRLRPRLPRRRPRPHPGLCAALGGRRADRRRRQPRRRRLRQPRAGCRRAVFDSVYLPQLGGGGGSQQGYFPGNAGTEERAGGGWWPWSRRFNLKS